MMMALPAWACSDEHVDGHPGVDRVEVGERLVDHDQVGLVDQGGDQLGLLLHAAAQVLDLLLPVSHRSRRLSHFSSRRVASDSDSPFSVAR